MNKYGYVRVAAVAPSVKVADVEYNVSEIIKALDKLAKRNVQIALFPELCLTGYSCGDLFYQSTLLNRIAEGLEKIRYWCGGPGIVAIVGAPIVFSGKLMNCAVVVSRDGLEFVPKTFIPNCGEYYEQRWFTGATADTPVFDTRNFSFGIEVCEDLWAPIPPSTHLALAGASLLFNLSASDALIGKAQYRRELVKQQSARTMSAYVYASAGPSESTTDMVQSGHLIIAENGSILAENNEMSLETRMIIADVDLQRMETERIRSSSFSQSKTPARPVKHVTIARVQDKINRRYEQKPFVPDEYEDIAERCKEILNIQSLGLAKRLQHTGMKTVLLGLSGGLDSTLALIVCKEAFDKLKLDTQGIHTVTMPGPGTSEKTAKNARDLVEAFGVRLSVIPIGDAIESHLKAIEHTTLDSTYENAQARERTQILMDLANKENGLVVGTSDMSELALGWTTYCGDHMSMYSLNCGVPKTLVKYVVGWYADQFVGPIRNALLAVCGTTISPELLPPAKDGTIAQKTEDLVGPYELHDFFLYYFLRCGFAPEKILYLATESFYNLYSEEHIKKWLIVFLKRFFANQFKRSCVPDGPKVGSVALSPRGDWRMPCDACVNEWLKELDR